VSEPAVILDTGPFVAFLVADDSYHAWASAQLQAIRPPLVTCEPVLVETFHLLRRVPEGARRFFDVLARGVIETRFDLLRERAAVRALVEKYASRPMSLADACLVRMAELNPGLRVFTVDADFHVYRAHGRKVIPTLMPPRTSHRL
jgi:predicted nucleic acid-binding protein